MQAMQSLMDNLTKSACGIAALGVLEVALPAVVIGVLIAIVCGFVVPAVYRQMVSQIFRILCSPVHDMPSELDSSIDRFDQ